MSKTLLFLLLFIANYHAAWADARYPGLQVEVKRDGDLYNFTASFDSPLSACAAYRYLTDYDAAVNLPGVLASTSTRQSAYQARVEQTDAEHILFFYVRLHSVMQYTEKPFSNIAFTQIKGDSKVLHGSWDITPNKQGSTLKFIGFWQPDTLIPLFIVDHFAKNGLIARFNDIATLAEKRKDPQSNNCTEHMQPETTARQDSP